MRVSSGGPDIHWWCFLINNYTVVPWVPVAGWMLTLHCELPRNALCQKMVKWVPNNYEAAVVSLRFRQSSKWICMGASIVTCSVLYSSLVTFSGIVKQSLQFKLFTSTDTLYLWIYIYKVKISWVEMAPFDNKIHKASTLSKIKKNSAESNLLKHHTSSDSVEKLEKDNKYRNISNLS